MKRRFYLTRTYLFIALAILVILLALGIFYTRSILISSCSVLSAQTVNVEEAIPFEGNVSGVFPCPAFEQEIIPEDPPNNEPPTSSSSGGSSTSIKTSPELNETNESKIGLSPKFEQNNSNQPYSTPFSRVLIDEYIKNNHLRVDCSIYNQTIPGTTTLVILDGYSNVSFLGIDISVPIKSRLVIADNQIILECIKRPWWAYLLR